MTQQTVSTGRVREFPAFLGLRYDHLVGDMRLWSVSLAVTSNDLMGSDPRIFIDDGAADTLKFQ